MSEVAFEPEMSAVPWAPDEPKKELTEEEFEALVPRPVGYHLLIAMPEVKDTFGDSGIVKPSKVVRDETLLSMVGLVLDAGSEAYGDEKRFPNGPWCKVGDYVMFRATSGTRFKVGGKEYRLLNDDTIEAVVSDPSAIRSVL